MIIKRINIKNFGKIHDKDMTLSPGINVLYGENESGKTTIHTFIKSMFFGVPRARGRAAKNDTYASYEPWENPGVYGGAMWFESGGRNFRLSRNFSKSNPRNEFLCEDDREVLDVEQGDLEGILGEVSEAVYDNTVSVAQLKSVTGLDLVRELQNYMASFQGTGDSSIDLGRTMQMLKMSRKGFQVQASRREQEIQKEKEKLAANMDYLRREMEELQERQEQVEERAKALHVGTDEEDGETYLDQRIERVYARQKLVLAGTILLGLLFAGLFAAVLLTMGSLILEGVLLAALVLCLVSGFLWARSLGKEARRQERLKNRWLSRQEKLNWNREGLLENLEEKETAIRNLEEEYQEFEAETYRESPEELEVRALNLAMETITRLSGSINHQVGGRLRSRTSQILGEITGGKYREVLMDENFRMTVNTEERIIPLERLSRGTLEQIYFALRMAAGELLCGDERFPVILDDVFGMYDEERLAAVLGWLHKEQRQIIISTCHRREMEILDKEGIPYQRLELS